MTAASPIKNGLATMCLVFTYSLDIKNANRPFRGMTYGIPCTKSQYPQMRLASQIMQIHISVQQPPTNQAEAVSFKTLTYRTRDKDAQGSSGV